MDVTAEFSVGVVRGEQGKQPSRAVGNRPTALLG
ncbi:hypothetical protein ABIB34_001778 [Rhodococcus sp. UYP5]